MSSDTASAELPKIPVPWRIYLLIGFVALLIAGVMGYSLRTGNEMTAKYAPLVDAAMEIKLEATTSHFLLEEMLSGDRRDEIAIVWQRLDESVWYARAMLEGGQSPEGTFIPLHDPQIRREIEEVLQELAAFRTVAEQRYAAKEAAGPGSEIYRRYHAMFADLIRQADDVETRLQELMRNELTRFRQIQIALIVTCLALAMVIGWVLHRYDRRRAQDFVAVQTATREAHANERRLSITLESMGDGVILTDPGGAVTYLNPVAATVTGWGSADAQGKDVRQVFNIVNEDTGEPAEDIVARVIREKHVVGLANHTVLIAKDGTRRPIADSSAPIIDDQGELLGVVLVFQDITERRRAERSLRETTTTLKCILNSPAEYAIAATDLDFRILHYNPAAERVFGYAAREVIGRTVQEMHTKKKVDPQRFEQAIEAVNRDGKFEYEVVSEDPDGKERYVRSTVVAMRDETGDSVGYILFSRDITERKRAEEERRQLEAQIQHTQKLESLGVLAGGIAHDFNNLLVGILGNAELALMDLSPVSPARESLKGIETAAMRAADLTRQMLAYSGKGRFVVQAIDLNEVVTEMGHLLEVSISKKVVLKYGLADDLPAVEADVTQIRQVVMNLITNASEAIGDKSGVISIATGAMQCDRAYLKTTYLAEDLPEGVYVYLEVADTGCGMDAETQGKIFDPFFTTKFAGRGLGLAAVQGIIRGHKGAQKVYSEPGRGTTFKVLLPAAEVPAEPREGERTDVEGWRGTGTILLVDDEETVCAVGSRMLERAGFTVLTAADGREAVEVFRQRADEIVCVILDLTMPHMDGEEAFRELRKIKQDVRVILSSGYNEQEAVNRFTGKGLAGFLQKPYRTENLLPKLQHVLEEVTRTKDEGRRMK